MEYKMKEKENNEYTDMELYLMLNGGGKPAHYALSLLYDRHSPRIYAYCRKVFGDNQAKDDAFQEAFIKLYETGVSGREVQNVQGYLLKIARNLCLNEKNRKYNTSKVSKELDIFPSFDISYEKKELMELIDMAMNKLPDDYKEALVLREMHGYSYVEIAEIVKTTMPVIRTRIYRAKIKVRDILSSYIQDLERILDEKGN
jgi:RNA polymerase sigma-70 factor (ECF subfamily)